MRRERPGGLRWDQWSRRKSPSLITLIYTASAGVIKRMSPQRSRPGPANGCQPRALRMLVALQPAQYHTHRLCSFSLIPTTGKALESPELLGFHICRPFSATAKKRCSGSFLLLALQIAIVVDGDVWLLLQLQQPPSHSGREEVNTSFYMSGFLVSIFPRRMMKIPRFLNLLVCADDFILHSEITA